MTIATINHLNHRYREIARRLLMGEKQKDIAQDLGISEEHLSRIKNSPKFKQYFEEMQARADKIAFDVYSHMAEHAKKAAETITKMLQDPETSGALKLAAAKEILKRVMTYEKKQGQTTEPMELKFEDILAIAEDCEI